VEGEGIMKRLHSARISFLILIAVLAVSTVFAETTSRLTGTVVDSDGVALPGVTVILTSDVLIGGAQNAIADADGGFSFLFLPPGQYIVQAELPGFQPVEVEARVALDRATQVHLTMVGEEFAGEIVVTGETPVVDVTRVNTGESYNEEFLKNAAVGSVGRDYLQVIGNEAGSAGTGNVNVFGSVLTDNVWLVDGLNTTDPLTGTFGTNFNFDAIQEVSIQTGGFQAEFGQALGGVINLVTKAGGNDFSGALDVRYSDNSLAESGDHFDADEDEYSDQQYAATLGGPILRDRLWFFTSVQKSVGEDTPLNSVLTQKFDGIDWIVKLTWQATAAHRLTFKASGDPAEIDNSNRPLDVLSFTTADAGEYQSQGGENYQVELNSVLSDTLLLAAHVGFTDGFIDVNPMSGDYETSQAYNYDTGMYEVNAPQVSFTDRKSQQYKAALTWFVDDLAGSHEFKGGLELRKLSNDGNNFSTGDQWFTYLDPEISGIPDGDVNGDGRIDYLMYNLDPQFREPVKSTGDVGSAFVQDQWRPVGNLTLQLGVRYDTAAYDNKRGTTVADFDKWQPRIGVAWDVTGNAKNIVRANYARFMHPGSTAFADTVDQTRKYREYYFGLETYCAFFGICDTETLDGILGPHTTFTDPYGNERAFYLGGDIGGDPFETVDTLGVGSLRAQYVDQYMLAYQRAFGKETALEIMYVNKESRDLIEDTCRNNTWAWGDGSPPDFDDDSTWTEPDGCTGFVITNLDVLTRDYEGYIAKFETRYKDLRILADYTYSESRGTTEADLLRTYATGYYDEFPRDFYNVDGRLSDDREHRFKLQGFWALPYQFTVGFNYFYSSEAALDYIARCSSLRNATDDELLDLGIPLETRDGCGFSNSGELLVEPRGNRRAGNTRHELDLQVSKGFNLGARARIELIVAAYNLLSVEQGLSYQEREFQSPEWGTITTYSQPRRWELGFRFEF
jgi:hypothetical protein